MTWPINPHLSQQTYTSLADVERDQREGHYLTACGLQTQWLSGGGSIATDGVWVRPRSAQIDVEYFGLVHPRKVHSEAYCPGCVQQIVRQATDDSQPAVPAVSRWKDTIPLDGRHLNHMIAADARIRKMIRRINTGLTKPGTYGLRYRWARNWRDTVCLLFDSRTDELFVGVARRNHGDAEREETGQLVSLRAALVQWRAHYDQVEVQS